MLKAGSAARRVSLHFDPPHSGADITRLIEHYLHAVDLQLQTLAPAWVGHCKLLIDADGHVGYGSTTMAGDDVRWTGAVAPTLSTAELTVYAAIYNLSDEQVAHALDMHLPQLATTASA